MVTNYYLRRWKNAGLISEEQEKSIREFEQNGPSFALYGFSALGGFTVLTGIISLIAFNWENIPGYVKLLSGFLVLGSSGAAAWYFHGKKAVSELLFLLYFGLIIGMIGLTGQVFHLSGPVWRPLLFWTLPSLPMVLISGSRLTVHVWIAAFLSAVLMLSESLTGLDEEESFLLTSSFILHIIIWGSVILRIFIKDKMSKIHIFTEALRSWSFLTAAATTVMYAGFGALNQEDIFSGNIRAAYSLTAAVSAMGIFLVFSKFIYKDYISAGILTALLLIHTVYFLFGTSGNSGELTDAVLFTVLWGVIAVYAAKIHNIVLFDIAVIGTGLRILIVYFQIFENMAYTGFGLIFTGLLILGAAYGWYRIHKAMIHSAGGSENE